VKQIILLCIIASLFIGCAASRYNIANKYLENGQTQLALREYLKILHEDKRQHGGFTDIQAMLGAASAYLAMNKFSKTQGLCKRILKIDSNNGGALFYAGRSLEANQKKKWAIKFYKRYRLLPDYDPYKRFMIARLEMLMQEEIAKNIRAAIRRERNIRTDDFPKNTIAVLYFINQDQDPEWEPLSKGIAEMIITDLAQVKKLKVVERIKLQKLIDEMNFVQSDLANPKTVPRFGKLLRARTLVNGGFTIPGGTDFLLTSNISDVDGAKSFEASRFSGNLQNIFNLEKDIVMNVLDQLGVELSYEERDRIMRIPTRDFQAFVKYCNGLEQMDRGNYSMAAEYFQSALKLDPNFILAQQKFQVVDAMYTLASGRPITAGIRLASRSAAAGQPPGLPPQLAKHPQLTSSGRLGRISTNLDLGYLPGNDGRKDAAELRSANVSLDRSKLPEPPDPPTSR